MSLFIFVICMEYFTRIMYRVATLQGITFHCKCKGLQLNYLCFADDMLLFCKEELHYVAFMLRGLASISNALGLTTNATKSNIYSANMERKSVEDICEMTRYKKDTLPFRYLGVPISSKKISYVDCEMLVERICARIQSWCTRIGEFY